MLKKLIRPIHKDEKGITGLETAIILIAFVVVAAVFAYTVLSAGLFSTQKGQEAVYSGLEETQSTLELKGAVVAHGESELHDGNCWVNTNSTKVTTFQQDTANKATAPGSVKLVADADYSTTAEVICYHDLDVPVSLSSGDKLNIWLRNNDGVNALDVANGLELVLDTDTTHTGVVGTWSNSLTFTGSLAASTASTFESSALGAPVTVYAVGLKAKADFSTTSMQLSFDDIEESTEGSPQVDTCDAVWTPTANINFSGSTTNVEGYGAAQFTLAGAAISSATELGTIVIPTRDLSSNGYIHFWIRSSVDVLDDATEYMALILQDDGGDRESSQGTVGALTAGTWKKVSWDISSLDVDSVDEITLKVAGSGPSVADTSSIYIDIIETEPVLSTTYPMKAYADELVFTVSCVAGGEDIDFTMPTDSDSNGLPDANSQHKVVISFNDPYMEVSDISWSKSVVGKDDGDNLLEIDEKFQITVDLSYVNNQTTLDVEKLGINRTFTVEVKPPKGAVLIIERTMPGKVMAVNNLW